MITTATVATKRCFLAEPMKRDNYGEEKLKRFGEIEYIFGHDARRPSVFNGAELSASIEARLDELHFDPEHDYIVLAGSINMLCTLVAVASTYEKVNSLMYCVAQRNWIVSKLG